MVARSTHLRAGSDRHEDSAIVGALTAIFAASIGLVPERHQARPGVTHCSQLGYMFLALGVGALRRASSMSPRTRSSRLCCSWGRLSHPRDEREQDMRNMGTSTTAHPSRTGRCSLPRWRSRGFFPFAGFFSKDAILWQTWTSEGSASLWFG